MTENIPDKHDLRRKRMLANGQRGLLTAILILAVLVGGVFWWGGQTRAHGEPPVAGGLSAPGVPISEGQRLYLQFCSSCHAQNGSGNPAANVPALDSAGTAWQKPAAELKLHILDGGQTMPELRGLVSDADADQLLAYIQIWWTPDQLKVFREASAQDQP